MNKLHQKKAESAHSGAMFLPKPMTAPAKSKGDVGSDGKQLQVRPEWGDPPGKSRRIAFIPEQAGAV